MGAVVVLTVAGTGLAGQASAAPTAAGAGAGAYTVVAGDTLYSIARRNGTTVADLVARNGLGADGAIRAGQVLQLPPPESTYTNQASITYVVSAGDTLYSIARRYGTTAPTLASVNGLADPNALAVGQVLRIPVSPAVTPYTSPVTVPSGDVSPLGTPGGALTPAGMASYTVSAGDTVYAVARRFGVAVDAVIAANGLTDANKIRIGQVLRIPGASTTPPPVPAPQPTAPPSAGELPRSLFGSTAADPTRLSYIPLFDRYADAYGVPRNLVKGLAFVESGWRADALSSAGAVGLGQLLPSTATWVATTMMGDPSLDPHRPEDNVRMTARYLRYLIDQTGDEQLAVGCYYQGIGSVRREGVKTVTQRYIERVYAARAAFGG